MRLMLAMNNLVVDSLHKSKHVHTNIEEHTQNPAVLPLNEGPDP